MKICHLFTLIQTGIGTDTGTKSKVKYHVETLVWDRYRDQNPWFPIVPFLLSVPVPVPFLCSVNIPLVDPSGLLGCAPPSLGAISFIFMQFSANILPNNRFEPPPLRLKFVKFWIRHCIPLHWDTQLFQRKNISKIVFKAIEKQLIACCDNPLLCINLFYPKSIPNLCYFSSAKKIFNSWVTKSFGLVHWK